MSTQTLSAFMMLIRSWLSLSTCILLRRG